MDDGGLFGFFFSRGKHDDFIRQGHRPFHTRSETRAKFKLNLDSYLEFGCIPCLSFFFFFLFCFV